MPSADEFLDEFLNVTMLAAARAGAPYSSVAEPDWDGPQLKYVNLPAYRDAVAAANPRVDIQRQAEEAKRSQAERDKDWAEIKNPSDYPLRPPRPKYDDEDAADVPIWNYHYPEYVDGKIRVKTLTCRVNEMEANMRVCDAIEWGPVKFDSKPLGSDIALTLDEDFLIRSRFLPQGSIVGADNKFWKLDANTDQSFEMVFGYEFDLPVSGTSHANGTAGGGRQPVDGHFVPGLVPASPVARKLTSQMGGSSGKAAAVSISDLHSTTFNKLVIAPLRIIVVVTLVCCKEKSNFDPGGVLGVGRFYPMIMVHANMGLDTVTGTVRIDRPPKMIMEMDKMDPGCKMSMGSECTMERPSDELIPMKVRSESPELCEWMRPEIGAIFFADKNPAPTHSLPYWTSVFDYYDVMPAHGENVEYVMANRPPKDQLGRVLVGVEHSVEDAEVTVYEDLCDGLLPGVSENSRAVKKVAGQGEFDNIHVAPKMVFKKEDIQVNVLSVREWWGLPKDLDLKLDPVIMAPFCIHDCMHLHTRWGTHDSLWVRGWSDDQTPNAVPGALLVPTNQKVTLKLLSASSFEYTAEAENANPYKWQIIIHHGCGYALSTGALAALARTFTSEPMLSSERAKWTAMYWNWRWIVSNDKLYQRLTFDADTLKILRKG